MTQGQVRPDVTIGEAPYVQLMGPPMLHGDGRTVPMAAERRFQLLALLALSEGRWVSRERIAGLLWPDRPADQGRRNLRKVIFRLHGLPGLAALEVAEHGLRWPVQTDVGLLLQEQDAQASDALESGAERLLDGLDDGANPAWSEWLAVERERAEQGWRRAALTQLARLADTPQRVALAQRMLLADPLDEAAVAALLRAEQAGGVPALAQRVFTEYAARLAEELGIEPSAELRALARAPTKEAPTAAAAALPRAIESRSGFVGRRHELAALAELLADAGHRLVTLVGPGGIGKSRLAREALAQLSDQFPDGTLWVALHDLDSRAQVVARLAQQLELELQNATDLRPFERWLAGRRALLVFDNAEDLVEAHDLFDRLAAAGKGSRVLVTSRVRTARPGERLLSLHGLSCPDEGSRDLQTAASFDAVRLFEQRARVAQPEFDLAAQLPGVIAAVDAVGGMPLAIELAASWMRMLPAAEIARDVNESLEVLERDPRSSEPLARPEHASLRAVVEHSFGLLVPREREALARLSVFVGGFDRKGAREVAGAPLPLLSSLVDKSLVAGDGSGRFSLHPVIAAYAAHALRDQLESHEDAHRRHAEYCARWVGALAPYALRGQQHRFSALELDMPNVRAAWLWSVADGRVDLVEALVVPLGYAFSDNGRFLEGLKLLRPALAIAANGANGVRASGRLHATLAGLCSLAGSSEEAYQFAKTVIDAGENGSDLEAYVSSRSTLGSYFWRKGRFQEALAHDQQAVAASRRHGDRYFPSFALGKLAVSLQALGRLDEAMSTGAEAIAMTHESGNWQLRASLMTYAASMHGQRGDWSTACEMLREALQMAIDAQVRALELFVRQRLGAVLLRLGNSQEARRHLEQVGSRAQALAWDALEQTCQRDLAQADLMDGRPEAAIERLRPALRAFVSAPRAPAHLRTLMVYGQWLAALRRGSEAREVWRLLLADTRLDADGRGQAQAALQALTSEIGDEAIAAVVPAAPDWEAFATRLSTAPALLPGNGKETPPA